MVLIPGQEQRGGDCPCMATEARVECEDLRPMASFVLLLHVHGKEMRCGNSRTNHKLIW